MYNSINKVHGKSYIVIETKKEANIKNKHMISRSNLLKSQAKRQCVRCFIREGQLLNVIRANIMEELGTFILTLSARWWYQVENRNKRREKEKI